MKWILCINNDDYEASLETRKLYEQINDPVAERMGMVRIIDESGEDYLYKKSMFIEIPATFGQKLSQTLSV